MSTAALFANGSDPRLRELVQAAAGHHTNHHDSGTPETFLVHVQILLLRTLSLAGLPWLALDMDDMDPQELCAGVIKPC